MMKTKKTTIYNKINQYTLSMKKLMLSFILTVLSLTNTSAQNLEDMVKRLNSDMGYIKMIGLDPDLLDELRADKEKMAMTILQFFNCLRIDEKCPYSADYIKYGLISFKDAPTFNDLWSQVYPEITPPLKTKDCIEALLLKHKIDLLKLNIQYDSKKAESNGKMIQTIKDNNPKQIKELSTQLEQIHSMSPLSKWYNIMRFTGFLLEVQDNRGGYQYESLVDYYRSIAVSETVPWDEKIDRVTDFLQKDTSSPIKILMPKKKDGKLIFNADGVTMVTSSLKPEAISTLNYERGKGASHLVSSYYLAYCILNNIEITKEDVEIVVDLIEYRDSDYTTNPNIFLLAKSLMTDNGVTQDKKKCLVCNELDKQFDLSKIMVRDKTLLECLLKTPGFYYSKDFDMNTPISGVHPVSFFLKRRKYDELEEKKEIEEFVAYYKDVINWNAKYTDDGGTLLHYHVNKLFSKSIDAYNNHNLNPRKYPYLYYPKRDLEVIFETLVKYVDTGIKDNNGLTAKNLFLKNEHKLQEIFPTRYTMKYKDFRKELLKKLK